MTGNHITIWAAGSLRAALMETAERFREEYGIEVKTKFGPSGVLRRRIEGGEHPDVFASANVEHPQRLRDGRLAGPPVLFAHNEMCAFGPPNAEFHTTGLLEYMLNPNVRLVTSTPGHDPSGDYAWEVFRRAEKVRTGAFTALSNKAQQLVGGPTNSAPVNGQSPVVDLLERNRIDIFLGYRSSARAIQLLHPEISVVDLPAKLALRTDCGLTILAGARFEAAWLAMFILSDKGQAILEDAGFQPVTLGDRPAKPPLSGP